MEFYGVGPGIKIEIATDYSISGFTAVNKELKLPTRNPGIKPV